jgi:5-methylcytosine-specific restriction protein A
MPTAPLRPCPHPRCAVLTRGGLCRAHQRARARAGLYDTRWSAYSQQFLAEHPHCGDRADGLPPTADSACRAEHRQAPATQTDHITPHGGDLRRFWDRRNHQALCAACHARKTRRENEALR